MTREELMAINLVLDKLFAPVNGPVEFASDTYRRSHAVRLPPLTSEEITAARRAVRRAMLELRDG